MTDLISPVTTPGTMWAPPRRWDQDTHTKWVLLGNVLADQHIITPRTTEESARAWGERVHLEWLRLSDTSWAAGVSPPNWQVAEAALVVRCGIAVCDLFAVAEAALDHTSVLDPNSAGLNLILSCQVIPYDMPMRSVIGWLTIGGQTSHLTGVEEWAQVGLEADGWLYAAAGLTPTEAVDGLAAGVLDGDAVRTMIALRGVALPTG